MRAAVIALLACGCRSILGIDDPVTPPDAEEPGACIEREPAAAPYMHTIIPNESLAGEPCLGCHHDAAAPPFDLAGTVYSASGAPEAGVHVRVSDGADRVQIVATDEVGNFFLPAGSGLVFPLRADVSDCPTVSRMVAPLTDPTQGNCNACHDGELQARIHLVR